MKIFGSTGTRKDALGLQGFEYESQSPTELSEESNLLQCNELNEGHSMEVDCPHCQAILTVHPSEAGSLHDCPKCNGKFHVPVPMARPRDPSSDGRSNPYAPNGNPYQYNLETRDFVGKKIAAGICGILFGWLGVHKFILGLNNAGIIMLAVTLSCFVLTPCLIVPIFGLFAMQVIGFIEGIIYLTMPDDAFYQTYGVEKKEWF